MELFRSESGKVSVGKYANAEDVGFKGWMSIGPTHFFVAMDGKVLLFGGYDGGNLAVIERGTAEDAAAENGVAEQFAQVLAA